MTLLGKKRKQRVCTNMFDKRRDTQLLAKTVISILPMCKIFILAFETKRPMLHKLHHNLKGLFQEIIKFFIKTQDVRESSKYLQDMNLNDGEKHIPTNHIFTGKCDAVLKNSKKDAHAFKSQLKRVYVCTAQYMQKKLPLHHGLFSTLSLLDPLAFGQTETGVILKRLPPFFPTIQAPDFNEELMRMQSDMDIIVGSDADLDVWWNSVFKLKRSGDEEEYLDMDDSTADHDYDPHKDRETSSDTDTDCEPQEGTNGVSAPREDESYMRLRGLIDIFSTDSVDAGKNAEAFAELLQCLDDKSLSLIIRDPRDNGKAALKILRDHYLPKGKPRIITLYTELTSLRFNTRETLTEFIVRAETLAAQPRETGETISDSLLIAMIMKALPDQCKPFVAVNKQYQSAKSCTDTQSSHHNFAFLVSSNTDTSQHENSFLIDSGATVHIINDKDKFVCFKSSFGPENHVIQLADGTKASNVALAQGDATVLLQDHEGVNRELTLKNAFHVPSFQQSIISAHLK
ncbi:hypothetical protein RRG08_032218 [Elysia crispata]|uniref:Retrovirus-related Pol polyprotein from transposon TNT 1-94-like beta-barrel domain-containing protein n=1 Tax=Elysia crispata TaxID=231223 RepID=A0AAE1AC21_9GAST|nr:hypothetical protein RRG08_032218 [Elysia crispata]